jgi:hypothetical protein
MRIPTFVPLSLLALLMPTLAWSQQREYAVSISSSETDPWLNHVSELPGTEFSVYLWLTCGRLGSEDVGMSSLEAIVTGDYAVTAYEPLSGSINAGSADHILVAVPACPKAPLLLGRWSMQNAESVLSGGVCLRSPPEYGAPEPSCLAVHCLHALKVDIAGVTGFSVGGTLPCRNARGCVGRRAERAAEGPRP